MHWKDFFNRDVYIVTQVVNRWAIKKVFYVLISLRNPGSINRTSFSTVDHLSSFDVQIYAVKLQKGM